MTRKTLPTKFFVDRSLGKSVVEALRASGLDVVSMAEFYGEKIGQGLADEVWLKDAKRENWIVLTKDDRIRRRPRELSALVTASVRVFVLTNAQLSADQQIERFLSNSNRILMRARKPGPYVYGVYEDTIKLLWGPDGPH